MEEDLSELLKIYGVGAAPARKAVQTGTLGRPIQLLSNLYNVTVQAPTLYRYEVSISKVDRKQTSGFKSSKKIVTSVKLNHRAVIKLTRDGHLGSCLPAYDGRGMMYLTQRLPDKITSATVRVNLDDDSECDEFARTAEFEISLKDVGPLSLRIFNAEVVQALDIIVRTGPLIQPNIVPVGRSFFTRQNTTISSDVALRGCKELWFGYFCSIRPGQWKPMLNVNLSATLFHESLPLIAYVCKFFNKADPGELKKGLKNFEQETLKRELQGVKIKVTHLPYRRQYKVAGISKKGATDYTFDVNGTQVSVAEYFEKHYGIQLQYPALQCVETLAKDGKKNYIPMEVCETIEGQHAKMVNSDQTAVLIQKTALSPIERFQNIDKFMKKVVHEDAGPHLKEFGLQVDLKPVQVRGRVLNAPDLEIGKQDFVKPREGYWRMDNRRQFFAGAELSCWGVADCHGSKRVADFTKNIERLGNNLGMKIQPPAFVKSYQRAPAKKMLSEIKSEFPQIVMILVIMGRETEYETIKQLSENDEDLLVMTQCIKGASLESKKYDNNFMINVLMKMNTKLGGINNCLTKVPACMREPYIVFGADVSHPGPMNKVQPSIAAVVGSLDSTPSQYHTVTSFQRSSTCNRLEYIANLKVMIKDCLRAFYRRNHTKPMTLLFFRDGVSDSQFEAVRAFEILQIRMACKELQDDYEPPLTFIVVQKRHQVRFKPLNDAEGQGRHKNIPAGTVIEDTVTHPVNFDYFLCSHAGIQGTSKPAHYQVLHDDANRSADELQAISYSLCHVYGRCSRSVSIPAPVYYAHLAAARAKDHFKAADIHPSSTSDRSSGIESGSSLLQREIGRDMDLYDLKRRSSNVDTRMRDYLYYI